MQYSKVIITIAALAAGSIAAPQNPSSGGHSFSSLQCTDPSGNGRGGSKPAENTKLTTLAAALVDDQDYCVTSNGKGSGKTWALAGNCGDDSTSIWLESYNSGTWCLQGSVIKAAVTGIVSGCESNSDGRLYGYYSVDGQQQWVEVGKSSSGCQSTG